jgi:hypothetical protein
VVRFELGTTRSRSLSHRLSCNPVRSGSFPLDLSESENDLPGDFRGEAPVPEPEAGGSVGAGIVGGVIGMGRAGAGGGDG